MTLELRNVAKRIGTETHIYETNITLSDEGFNILLGTTLAGKTSLMQLMAGLDQPSSGEIWFNGKNVTGVPVQKRNVSMVYQQFINYPNLSVFENIASPLRVARISGAELNERVHHVSEILKLTPMLDRKPSELSGGQQQRTALARALVKDADLVLLDEPLANLDFKLREELRDQLPKLFADRKCTVVYATTEPTEALLLGGYTAAMFEGRIIQYGPTSDIYRRPDNISTARVFSDPPLNTAPIRKRGERVELIDGVDWTAYEEFATQPDGEYIVGVRPHHVGLNGDESGKVVVSGQVLITELSGSESVIHFTHNDLTWVSLSQGVQTIRIGQTASFNVDTDHCLYFNTDGSLAAANPMSTPQHVEKLTGASINA